MERMQITGVILIQKRILSCLISCRIHGHFAMTKGTFRDRCVHVKGVSAKTSWNEIFCRDNTTDLKLIYDLSSLSKYARAHWLKSIT